MGVKALEITGGGEPLIYRYLQPAFQKIADYGFDVDLVTNGVPVTENLVNLIAPVLKWVRISIDASLADTYSFIRKVPITHFDKAWNAVSMFSKAIKDKKHQKVGVGFVVTNDNYEEIFDATRLAVEYGADNIRISAAFLPGFHKYFNKKTIEVGCDLARQAYETFHSNSFSVFNMFDERVKYTQRPYQDYSYCGTKDFLCVIGGDLNVYTCCSLAFNKKGLVGSIRDQRFKEL